MGSDQRFTTLVLAGRREAADPLAEAAGAPHRALLDIHGTPMLARVLDTLTRHPRVGRILLSMDSPELLDSIPSIKSLLESREVVLTPNAASPSRSVLKALDELTDDEPLLLTTADHALLDEEMLDHFLDRAEASRADVAVGLVSATTIEAAFPEVQRTYLPFSGERYSGANLFAFLTPQARLAIEFWKKAEAHRKTPWKLVSTFGVSTLALFLARQLDLTAAFQRVSKAIGVKVRPVEMPMAEASVDVDKVSDLELVRRILE